MEKSILCLMNDGFEETELVAPVDLLRRAGIKVVIAAMGGKVATGKEGIRIEGDALLSEVDPSTFDVLMIPGGPAVEDLLKDGRAATLAKSFAAAGKVVAAICAAPLVLNDAGLLEGRRFTCYASVREMLTDALDERVVVDGDLITSCGPGTALDFGFAIISHLLGDEMAAKIKEETMA